MSNFSRDILIYLFSFFDNNNLCLSAKICKEWRQMTMDYYPWTDVGIKIVLRFATPMTNVKKKTEIVKSITKQDFATFKVEFNSNTIYGKPDFNSDEDVSVSIYISRNPELWRGVASFVPNDAGELSFITINYQINLSVLEKKNFHKGYLEHTQQDFVQDIMEKIALSKVKTNKLGIIKPRINFQNTKQPEGFQAWVKLFDYQIDALSWLLHVENSKIEIPDTQNIYGWRSRNNVTNYNSNTLKFNDPPKEFKYPKGGILADEMGLGKTITFIALILANPVPPVSASSVKTIKSKNKNKRDKEAIEASKKVFLDFLNPKKGKKKKVPKNSDDSNEYKDVDVSHLLYPTQASLVLCPSHLVKQWQEETKKFTEEGKLKVITMTTIEDLKSISYKNIIEADMVIASYELFKNPTYFHIGHITPAPSVRVKEELRRINWIKRYLEELREEENGGVDNVAPILDHFSFRRIILDEVHEVISKDFYINTILNLHKETCWISTGTPFTGEIFVSYRYTLLLGIDKMITNDDLRNNTTMDSFHFSIISPAFRSADKENHIALFLAQNVTWRNTAESIATEYVKPAIKNEMKLIEFSPLEALNANKESTVNDLSLCCFLGPHSLSWHRLYFMGECRREMTLTLDRLDEFLRQQHKQRQTVAQIQEEIDSYKKSGHTVPDTLNHNLQASIASASVHVDKIVRITKQYEEYRLTKPQNFVKFSTERLFGDISDTAIIEIAKQLNDLDDLNKSFTGDLPESLKDNENEEEKGEEEGEQEEEKETKKKPAPKRKGAKRKAPVSRKKGAKKAKVDPEDEEEKPKDENEEETEKNDQEDEKMEVKNEEIKEEIKEETKEEKKDEEKDTKEEEENKNDDEKSEHPAKIDILEEPKTPELTKEDSNPANNEEILRFLVEEFGTKVGHLLYYLRDLWTKDPTARILIFSKYSDFLDYIGSSLKKCGVLCGYVKGNVLRRTKAISTFKSEDVKIRVLLMSFTASASGTNLIEASHVIFIDQAGLEVPKYKSFRHIPRYSDKSAKTSEDQAIGRAHRQGQRKNVTVTRFLVKNSVEERLYKYVKGDIAVTDVDQQRNGRWNYYNNNNRYVHLDHTANMAAKPSLSRSSSLAQMLMKTPAIIRSGALDKIFADSENNNNNNNNDF